MISLAKGVLLLEIKVATKITYPMYKEYAIFSIYKSKFFKIANVFCFIMIIFVAFFITKTMIDYGFDIVLFILLFVLALCIAVLLVYPVLTAKIYYKSGSKLYSNEICFSFYDDHLVSETKGSDISSASNSNYNIIQKIYETKNYFYLFITRQQAFIVPKNDIVSGSADELSTLLKSKVESNRYIKSHK